MIKVMLVIYAITAQGPAVETVAEFTHANRQYCEEIGTLLVKKLKKNKDIRTVTYHCVEETAV